MGWMSKLFGSEEETHRRSTAKKRTAEGDGHQERTAAKKTAAKKAVPAQSRASHEHSHADEPERTGSPSHPTKSAATGNTLAHDQMLTVHILTHVPEHAPREDDPHYHLFEQAKARLKRQGLWKCIIGDDLCDGDPELHHTHVEFSQINQVDEKKIEQALGLHFANDEEFQQWAESPGNLEVLCANHHRAHYGIHVIPGPLWEAVRFHKTGTGPAAEFIPADQLDDQKDDDDDKKPAPRAKAAAK